MLSKVRPNVLVLAGFGALLTGLFGYALIAILSDGDGADFILAVVAVLSMLVGIGVGGLMTLSGQVATDPPPPTVSAEVHLAAIRAVAGLEDAETREAEL